MTDDLDLEAYDLRMQDAFDRKLHRHRLQHWHPLDPDRLEDDFEEPPEQEISISGVELLEKDGQQLLKKVDNAE